MQLCGWEVKSVAEMSGQTIFLFNLNKQNISKIKTNKMIHKCVPK